MKYSPQLLSKIFTKVNWAIKLLDKKIANVKEEVEEKSKKKKFCFKTKVLKNMISKKKS